MEIADKKKTLLLESRQDRTLHFVYTRLYQKLPKLLTFLPDDEIIIASIAATDYQSWISSNAGLDLFVFMYNNNIIVIHAYLVQ